MSYQTALEKAGAIVHVFEMFGSYQGDWFAKVTFKGETGWVNGSYGSCSGCDAFEGEFNYNDHESCHEHQYTDKHPECEECKKAQEKYDQRLADFGLSYLETLMTQEQIEKYASENSDYSLEDGQALKWIQENKITP